MENNTLDNSGNEVGNDAENPNVSIPTDEAQNFDLEILEVQNTQTLPIQILPTQEIHRFLKCGVLKPVEHPKVREGFLMMVVNKRVQKIMVSGFWLVMVIKYPFVLKVIDEQNFVKYFRRKISKNYVQLLTETPNPKDDILNLIFFSVIYIIHSLYYKYFARQRELFDMRFIFDCYHIVIFQINGIYITDQYIRHSIQKFFTTQFLEYQKHRQPQIKEKPLNKQSFLGFPLKFPGVDSKAEVKDFQNELDRFFQQQKPNASSSISLGGTSGGNKQASTQLPSIDQKSNNAKQNGGPDSLSPSKKLDLDGQNVNEDQQLLGSMSQENKGSMNSLTKQMQASIQPTNSAMVSHYFGTLQLNCNQVSPTISKALAYDGLTLPFAQKKMIKHAFETISDHEEEMLQKLKQYNQKKNIKQQNLIVVQPQMTILDHFSLRAPGKEYYHKNQNEKVDKLFKDMLNWNYILQNCREGVPQLQSSKRVLERMQGNNESDNMFEQMKEKQKNDKLNDDYQISSGLVSKLEGVTQNLTDQQNQSNHLMPGTNQNIRLPSEQQINLRSLPSSMNLGSVQSQTFTQNLQSIGPSTSQNPDLLQSSDSGLAFNKSAQLGSGLLQSIRKPSIDKGIIEDEIGFHPSSHPTIRKNKIAANNDDIEYDMHRVIPISVIDEKQKYKDLIADEDENPIDKKQAVFQDFNQEMDMYKEKRKVYRDKYNQLIESWSTDTKINDIVQNLHQKKHLVEQGLKSMKKKK